MWLEGASEFWLEQAYDSSRSFVRALWTTIVIMVRSYVSAGSKLLSRQWAGLPWRQGQGTEFLSVIKYDVYEKKWKFEVNNS